MKKVSLLTPSRGRPDLCERMVESFWGTVEGPAECLLYVDDDEMFPYLTKGMKVTMMSGPQRRCGVVWNELAEISTGDLLMMGNDDLIFRTPGWNKMLQDLPEDGIFVAWFDDGSGKAPGRCAFPIVSRRWYETLGYFTPECFHYLYNDTWITDIGKKLGRLFYIPDGLVEHMHFAFGKAPKDKTYMMHREGAGDKRGVDGQTFLDTATQRNEDVKKLKGLLI